jgi:hypothetical protein
MGQRATIRLLKKPLPSGKAVGWHEVPAAEQLGVSWNPLHRICINLYAFMFSDCCTTFPASDDVNNYLSPIPLLKIQNAVSRLRFELVCYGLGLAQRGMKVPVSHVSFA